MTVNLSALAGAGQQFFSDAGVPLSGGKLYSYVAGTTTPQAAYTSASGATPLSNPIILNSAGRVATGEIWLTTNSSYKFILKTSTDATIATWDNIIGINGISPTINAVNVVYNPAGIGAVSTNAQAKLRESVSVLDFGADATGSADSTTAFTNAFATNKAVYAPAGTYLLNFLNVPSNTFLFGDGFNTIIKPLTPDVRCALGADSGSASTYIENITIQNIRFLGDVFSAGFNEQKHLTSFNGVKNLLIQACYFIGFRGDGIYLGSGNTAGQERHNVGVSIKDCVFDGINNNNRNGISVIDVDDILIFNSVFQNTTKTGMPGAIDFEPNSVSSVIKNVLVFGNTFSAIGGDSCIVVNTATAGVLTSPLSNYNIQNNIFNSSVTSTQTLAFNTAENVATVGNMGINISENYFLAPNIVMNMVYVNGVTVSNNVANAGSIVVVGREAIATLSAKNVCFSNNTFSSVGDVTGLLSVATVENFALLGNTFKPKDTCTRCVVFLGSGVTTTSTNVNISNNTFVKGTSQITAITALTHTYLTPKTNVYFGNTVDASLIVAYSNQTFGNWTPVLTASTPGDLAVVYSTQVGTYSKVGRLVTINFNITTSTWTFTTAAGVLCVTGLPYTVSTSVAATGSLYGSGWTLAGVSGMSCAILSASTFIDLYLSRSGASVISISPTTSPSGTQQSYVGSITYLTDN